MRSFMGFSPAAFLAVFVLHMAFRFEQAGTRDCNIKLVTGGRLDTILILSIAHDALEPTRSNGQ